MGTRGRQRIVSALLVVLLTFAWLSWLPTPRLGLECEHDRGDSYCHDRAETEGVDHGSASSLSSPPINTSSPGCSSYSLSKTFQ